MRLAFLLLLLAADGTRRSGHERGTLADGRRGGSSASPSVSPPSFTSIPLTLAQQCDPTFSMSTSAGLITYTRSGADWCEKSDGTVVALTANQPPVGRMGLWWAPARTQEATNVRDFSNAAWVKSNMTCTQTATGADGVASAASTCTSSATDGTAIQSQTLGSAVRTASVKIRRRTGTGSVYWKSATTLWCDVTSALYVAMNNGCTWLNVRSTSDDIRDTAMACTFGCSNLTTSGTAWTPGLRLGTNGDAVDVDFAQLETGYYASSPINGASRSAPVVTQPGAGYPTSTGYWEALVTPAWTSDNSDPDYYGFFDSTPSSGVRFYRRSGTAQTAAFIRDTVTGNFDINNTSITGGGYNAYPTPQAPIMRPRMWHIGWSVASTKLILQGNTIASSTSANPPTTHGTVHLGSLYDDTLTQMGWMSYFRVAASVDDSHTKVATIGDSILDGANTVKVGEAIQFNLGWSSYLVQPLALSGTKINTAANDCTTRFGLAGTVNVVVYNCGINDILQGADGPTTWGLANTLLTTIRGTGAKVVVATIGPCGGYATCNNTANDSYNASLTAWCAGQGTNCVLVDANALFRDPNNASVLRSACDVNYLGGIGDHLHPSNSCSVEYAAALAAGVRALQ